MQARGYSQLHTYRLMGMKITLISRISLSAPWIRLVILDQISNIHRYSMVAMIYSRGIRSAMVNSLSITTSSLIFRVDSSIISSEQTFFTRKYFRQIVPDSSLNRMNSMSSIGITWPCGHIEYLCFSKETSVFHKLQWMDVPLCSNDRTAANRSETVIDNTLDSFWTIPALMAAGLSSHPLDDEYELGGDDCTHVRSTVTRNAYPDTCCSQSFYSDGWKRDMNIPC